MSSRNKKSKKNNSKQSKKSNARSSNALGDLGSVARNVGNFANDLLHGSVFAQTSSGLINKVPAPQFVTGRDGRVSVRHREYITNLKSNPTTAGDYYVRGLYINPGLASLFPWLSNIAFNYESYRFKRLEFEFHPQVPTSSGGEAILSVDYDAKDSLPDSKVSLFQTFGAMRCPLWQAMRYVCPPSELAKLGPQRYLRYGGLAANLDVKTYDAGRFIFATTAYTGSADAQIGELFVTYDVELMTPQPYRDEQQLDNSLKVTGAGSVTKTEPFGTAPTIIGGLLYGSIGGASTLGGRIVDLVPGGYLLNFDLVGTGLVPTGAPTVTIVSGNVDNTMSSNLAVPTAATSGQCVLAIHVKSDYSVIDIDWTGAATTITAQVLHIAPYSYDYV